MKTERYGPFKVSIFDNKHLKSYAVGVRIGNYDFGVSASIHYPEE